MIKDEQYIYDYCNKLQWPYNPNVNNESKFRILIHVPIGFYDPECINSIHCLNHGPHLIDILFTYGNPIDPNYNDQGREKSLDILYANLKYKFEKAFSYAIANDFDFILNIEHDMVVYEDALLDILKLARMDGLISGLYRCRPTKNSKSPLAFTIPHPEYPNRALFLTKEEIQDKPLITNLRNICYGFLLIGKDFFSNHIMDGCDGRMSTYLYNKKIPIAVTTTVIVGHKDRTGDIIWP